MYEEEKLAGKVAQPPRDIVTDEPDELTVAAVQLTSGAQSLIDSS